MHNPETTEFSHASLLEGLSQAGPGLVPGRTARRLLKRRAHRLPADQQGDRQSAAPAGLRGVSVVAVCRCADTHLAYTYLVFDPGRRNNGGAEQVHGFSDWVLAVQDPFEVHAAQVWRFLTSYELLVAHNAAFDFRFINREMTSAGLSSLTRPIYCTMKGYRALNLGGSAALSAVCSQIKLARSGQLHAAIEDAWLAMQIYLWLHGCPFQRRLPVSRPRTPSNFRHIELGSQRALPFDHNGRRASRPK